MKHQRKNYRIIFVIMIIIIMIIAASVLLTACRNKRKTEGGEAGKETQEAAAENTAKAEATAENVVTEEVETLPASPEERAASASAEAQPQAAPIKSSNYEDGYVEGEDFNPSGMNWMTSPTSIAQSEEGCYFLAGSYVFFTDAETLSTVPLCFQTACLHYEETDPYKVPECQAFTGIGMDSHFIFLGAFQDDLIYICKNFTTLQREMIRVKKDGSSRQVLLSDFYAFDNDTFSGASYFRMHRGVIYYFSSVTDLDGNQTLSMYALPLLESGAKPRELYRISGNDKKPHSLLPSGNYVYFEITVGEENEIPSHIIYELDIRTGEVSEVFDQDSGYFLYGAQNGKIILAGNGYFEYSKETGIQEAQGIKHFREMFPFPESSISIECIDPDLMMFNVFDSEEGRMENLYVTDAAGELLCEIPDEGWGFFGGQMVSLGEEEYYVRYSKSLEPFTIKAFKKSDLLAGNPEYQILLQVEEFNENLNPAITVPTPKD